MKYFLKRKTKSITGSSIWMNQLVRFNERLVRLAGFLQLKMSACSLKKQKMFLGLFCLLFISASIRVAYCSLTHQGSLHYSVTSIHVIPLLKEAPKDKLPNKGVELQHIHRFKMYLDSLTKTEGGQVLRDSLLRGRPHLIDTLNYLDQLYFKP